jgi:hypothetical protein
MIALQRSVMCVTDSLVLSLPLLLLLLLLFSTGHPCSSQRCWVCAGIPCVQPAGHYSLPGVTHPFNATGGTQYCQCRRHQDEDTVKMMVCWFYV